LTYTTTHARISNFPFAVSLQGARLDNLQPEIVGRRNDLLLDYHQFIPDIPSKLCVRDGRAYEQLEGKFIPRRLRFIGIEKLEISGIYENLGEVPNEHPAREIRDMLRWIQSGHKLTFYLLVHGSQEPADLRFYARKAIQEDRGDNLIPISFERNWSSPPPTRRGLIPVTKKLYERFGGDSITMHLDGHALHRRLFIGGLENQSEKRPAVDAVLNLGEQLSLWAKDKKLFVQDRWANKGEGLQGMSADEIHHEAEWVVEHLKAGQRVLVHCVAGMNRSSTVCCAALMLLEGLSAEKALERVREHHPWARPDSNHWLALRWLEKTLQEDQYGNQA
jgi:Dual specificity phosphatase, catalytic domain